MPLALFSLPTLHRNKLGPETKDNGLPPYPMTLRQKAIAAAAGRRAVVPLAWTGSQAAAGFLYQASGAL